jgi:hypothetical protein
MARLPTPGGDNNSWGDILNDFLSVEHNTDGSLKTSGTIATKADDSAVVHNSGAETITGTKTFSASPIVPTPTAAGHAVTKSYVDSHTHAAVLSLPAYSKQGALSVATGTMRFPVDGSYTIVGTRLMVGTAPTGASLILDVNKNGTTIYTNQANRPTIAASANAGGPGAAPDVTTLVAGDYLTVDIDQIGSSIAGSDLTVAIVVSRTI